MEEGKPTREVNSDREERVTLTQRRAGGASRLTRPKLQPIGDDMSPEKAAGGGSAAKIVVWVLIVAALAAAAYFGIRNFTGASTAGGAQPTPTVTPTPDVAARIVSSTVLDDSAAVNLKAASFYNTTDQTVGKDSDSTYSIGPVTVEKYTSATRFVFEVTKLSGAEVFPLTTATYTDADASINVLFKGIAEDNSEIPFSRDIPIGTGAVISLFHDPDSGDNQEKFVIKLNAKTGYFLQTYTNTDSDQTLVFLDVKEIVVPTPTAGPTSATTVAPTSATVTSTPAVTTAAGAQVVDSEPYLTNFAQGSQTISTGNTGNNYQNASYNFSDAADSFMVNFFFGSGTSYPNIEATQDGLDITVKIKNQISGATLAEATFPGFTPAANVKGFVYSKDSHVTTYKFTLAKATNYRLSIDTTTNSANKFVRIEIKNK